MFSSYAYRTKIRFDSAPWLVGPGPYRLLQHLAKVGIEIIGGLGGGPLCPHVHQDCYVCISLSFRLLAMANENRQIHPMRKLVGPSRADIAYIFTFAQRWRRACVVEFELQLPKRPQAQQKTHRQIIRREHIAKSSKTRNSGQHRKTKKSLRATMEKPIQALKAKPNSTHT